MVYAWLTTLLLLKKEIDKSIKVSWIRSKVNFTLFKSMACLKSLADEVKVFV